MDDLIIVGDRVLIALDQEDRQTKAGLYLPASVIDKDRVNGGCVKQIGPGHLIPNPEYNENEPWAEPHNLVRYLPLEAHVGDYAFFLRKEAIEITYREQPFLIVPHSAILALIRPRDNPSVDALDDFHGH